MTNIRSKAMTLGNRLAASMGRSAAFVRAWQKVKVDMACADMDFAALAVGPVVREPSKPLVLDLRYSGDLGKYFGMLAREIATGEKYSYRA